MAPKGGQLGPAVGMVGTVRVYRDTYDKAPRIFEAAQWEEDGDSLKVFRDERRADGTLGRVVLATFEPCAWADVVLGAITDRH
jgi:hypothetical protein